MDEPIGSSVQGRIQGPIVCSVFPPMPRPWRRAVPQCQPLLQVPAGQPLLICQWMCAGEVNTGGQDHRGRTA